MLLKDRLRRNAARSKLAPTGETHSYVGASLLAKRPDQAKMSLSLSQLRMLIRIQQRFISLLHHLTGNRPSGNRTTHVQRRAAHVDQWLNRNQQRHQ